jgi:hypothetical protein
MYAFVLGSLGLVKMFWTLFNQFAQVEEDDVVAESSRPAERVRPEDYRIVVFEGEKLPLNVACRYRIQCRRGLVAQKNLWQS